MDDLLSEFLTETAESLDVVDVELVRFEGDPLAVAGGRQVIAGRGTEGQGGVWIGHGPEIGRDGRRFQSILQPGLSHHRAPTTSAG